MSENTSNLEESTVRYVYGNQEYILNHEEVNSQFGDLICSDGSRAILVDGQYLVTDNQALFLQEGDTNLTQYYINENSERFIVDEEETSTNTIFEETELVQFVEEDADTNDVPQIIYYTNDDLDTEVFAMSQQDLSDDTAMGGIQDEDGNIYPFKRIKLEGQMINFNDLIHKQSKNVSDNHQVIEEQEGVEYALLDDDANSSQEYNPEDSGQSTKVLPESQVVDLSKITGRNLITGQTVTLHSYMEKLKKKLKSGSNVNNVNLLKKSADMPNKEVNSTEIRKPELSDLLDKKISIGKTKSGKKIVGKIIHVEKKSNALSQISQPEEVTEESEYLMINQEEHSMSNELGNVESVSNNNDKNLKVNCDQMPKPDDHTKILVRRCSISKESFEEISKTLGGVMEMESVRQKLENKNIVVKLVEKRYSSENDAFIKNTSYSYGYMEKDVNQNTDGEVQEKWKFISDQTTQDVLLGDHIYHNTVEKDKSDVEETKSTKFVITTSLTIVISYGKGGHKTIRVNLNPASGNLCTICAQYFKTNLQLRHHMNNVHNTYGNNAICEVCDKSFKNVTKLQEHKEIHVQEGKLFICSECNKCFTSQIRLQKHLPSHDVYLRPLECSVCEVRCANEWALKKHLMTHVGIKPFSCDICQKQFFTQYDVNFHRRIHFPEKHFTCSICLRTFSRHSNLLRHQDIHKGTGALYKCDICYCSYNYISSLTRHMVQNHIDAADFRKKPKKQA